MNNGLTEKWSKEWENGKSCQYQKNFKLQKKGIVIKATRKIECIYSRLRLMHSKLNGCLYKIGKHTDGNCSLCNVKEDCLHFLLDCPNTENLRKEIQDKNPQISNWTYEKLLTNSSSIELIVKYIIKNNIPI